MRFQLNKEDLKAIGRGALVAMAGALITYASEAVTQIDFKEYTPIVVALSGVLFNALRKWIATGK